MTRNPKTIAFWRGRLPHWEVEEGRYFVTIHLAGCIPAAGRNRIHLLARQQAKLVKGEDAWMEHQRRIFREMEAWLDSAPKASQLGRKEIAELIGDAIHHREKRGDWRVFEFVAMPSHVHLFFELQQEGLKRILEDFKRWTGHQAGRLLGLNGGRFWQDEWFDHWSRSDEEDQRTILYIRQNPVKAGLAATVDAWPYRSK